MSIAPRVMIKDGYYLIPNFTKYVINERGDVKNLKTWESLSWQMNAYGYNTVNIYDAKLYRNNRKLANPVKTAKIDPSYSIKGREVGADQVVMIFYVTKLFGAAVGD